ncbi:MAG TPA: DUF3866 family protein, partial [Actinomycetota bacterium]|nr:DUF3866 family protein [Actinomycetota bacterium]
RHAGGADVSVVGMGPGIVGTGTLLGHTGMEQGQILNAAAALGGTPIAVLRISFADARERHRGVSHHTLSALRYGTLARGVIPIPELPADQLTTVLDQLDRHRLRERHEVRVVDAGDALAALDQFGLAPESMGRSVADDPAYHLAAGAAGIVAGELTAAAATRSDT